MGIEDRETMNAYVIGTTPEDAKHTYLYMDSASAVDEARDQVLRDGGKHNVYRVKIVIDWSTISTE